MQEIIATINAASTDVTASINASRDGLLLTDTSGGGGNLTIASADANETAEALGIVVDDGVDTIDSGSLNRQTISQSTRLATLNGGRGVQLGDIRITNAAGTSRTISLDSSGSTAETVGDVIDAINAAVIDVEARINDTGDGILIEDKSGGSGTLTVAEVAGRTTAADLNILGASASTNDEGEPIIDGSTTLEIDLSQLTTGTSGIPLSSLRGGLGITLGIFTLTDANGTQAVVDLGEAGSEAFTVADVIDKINDAATQAGAEVTAALNDAGTGIKLTDTSGGNGTLTVADLGTGAAASQLGIAGEATTGGESQAIFGDSLFTSAESSDSGVEALAARINEQNLGFTAQAVFDGSGHRLVVSSETTGSANQLLVRSSIAGFNFGEIAAGRDAVVQLGSTGGIVASSATNNFDNVLPGISFTVSQASSDAITIDVATDDSTVVDAAQGFVDSFNSLRTTINAVADFDPETLTTGILFGRNEIIRIESDLARILSGRITGAGSITSLESLGISFDDDGKGLLELDESKLRDAYATRPNDVERFFTTENSGVVAKLDAAISQLAGEENSVLAARSDALNSTIEVNNERISLMNEQLDRQRDRLLLDFYRLEETLARIQNNLASIESITAVEPLSFSRQ